MEGVFHRKSNGKNTFVPNEEKRYYDYASGNRLDIVKAARIQSIAATQTDDEAMHKAGHALLMLSLQNANEEEKEDFTFVIDDFTDYHHIDDFKSTEARQLFIDWQTKSASLAKQGKLLEERRAKYTQSSKDERQRMTEELLRAERLYELLETEVAEMPKAIRNAEVSHKGGK